MVLYVIPRPSIAKRKEPLANFFVAAINILKARAKVIAPHMEVIVTGDFNLTFLEGNSPLDFIFEPHNPNKGLELISRQKSYGQDIRAEKIRNIFKGIKLFQISNIGNSKNIVLDLFYVEDLQ